MKPTIVNESELRLEIGDADFDMVNKINENIVGDLKPLNLSKANEKMIDNIFERPRSLEEVFKAEGSAVYDVDLVLGEGAEPTKVFVNHFTVNLAVLSTMNRIGNDFETSYIGCYKRDEDKYVLFKNPYVVPMDEESKPFYKAAVERTKAIFNN